MSFDGDVFRSLYATYFTLKQMKHKTVSTEGLGTGYYYRIHHRDQVAREFNHR